MKYLDTIINVDELSRVTGVEFGYIDPDTSKPVNVELVNSDGAVIRRYRNPTDAILELAYLLKKSLPK